VLLISTGKCANGHRIDADDFAEVFAKMGEIRDGKVIDGPVVSDVLMEAGCGE
jgi:hypothetical protein